MREDYGRNSIGTARHPQNAKDRDGLAFLESRQERRKCGTGKCEALEWDYVDLILAEAGVWRSTPDSSEEYDAKDACPELHRKPASSP